MQLRKFSSDIRNNTRKDNSIIKTELLGQTSLDSILQHNQRNNLSNDQEAMMRTPVNLSVGERMGSSLTVKDVVSDNFNPNIGSRSTNININEGNFSPPVHQEFSPPVKQSRQDAKDMAMLQQPTPTMSQHSSTHMMLLQ